MVISFVLQLGRKKRLSDMQKKDEGRMETRIQVLQGLQDRDLGEGLPRLFRDCKKRGQRTWVAQWPQFTPDMVSFSPRRGPRPRQAHSIRCAAKHWLTEARWV